MEALTITKALKESGRRRRRREEKKDLNGEPLFISDGDETLGSEIAYLRTKWLILYFRPCEWNDGHYTPTMTKG